MKINTILVATLLFSVVTGSSVATGNVFLDNDSAISGSSNSSKPFSNGANEEANTFVSDLR